MGLLDLISEKFAKDAQAKLDADSSRGQATIKPSERSRLLGLLADAAQGANDFASQPFGYNNPPAKAILGLLGVPSVANTLNEMSYGGSLSTGKGMTWKPKADTLDAAMAVAPLAMAAPAAINKTAAAVGKAVAPAVERAVPAIMERGGLPAQLLQDMSQQTVSPLTVWHGSPHKFDKFDASKIGTGEGAQAYGHGLYVAESPEVATRYRDTLTNFRPDHIEAKLVEAGISPEFANTYSQFAAQTKGGARGLDEFAELMSKPGPSPYIEQFRQRIRAELPAARAASNSISGSLYKVDLPDDAIAKMLDWDKPMSEQPHVLKALGRLGIPASPTLTGEELIKGSLLKGLSNYDGIVIRGEEALRSKGIPGIRYLDGGSRGTGAGTSNFVVFPGNEGMLKILERNGQPMGLLGN